MLSGILRAATIAVILAAIGCSNQKASNYATGDGKAIEQYGPAEMRVSSEVMIDDVEKVTATLSDRRMARDGEEVSFAVATDRAIDGQTEFVISIFGHDLGGDRYTAGYRVKDTSGRVLWASEFGAKTTDMSWVSLRRSDTRHDWHLGVEIGRGVIRQSHKLDNASMVIEDRLTEYSQPAKRLQELAETTEKMKLFYAGADGIFDNKFDHLAIGVLTDATMIPWIAGNSGGELDTEDPQLISLGGWLALICRTVEAIEPGLCDPGSNMYNANLCTAAKLAKLACEALNILGIINYK